MTQVSGDMTPVSGDMTLGRLDSKPFHSYQALIISDYY